MMKPLVNREEPLKTGLRNYWYPLARAADLASKPRRALALGEELVLWRDSRGRAHIMRDRCPHRDIQLSLGEVVGDVLACAYHLRVPVTVHLAIGTDIPHMHPTADGAALGMATLYDFRLFSALVKGMHPGGVYMNWGSAVVLPEVFLKAISVVRNLGVPLRPITTANFDFVQHYRPLQNVVKRPTASASREKRRESRGYAITGHHEILLPLVAAALATGGASARKKKSKQ